MLKVLRKATFFFLLSCALINCSTCPKCKQIQTHGMRGADCYALDLERIPQCLRSDIEIIELSHNRIRKITTDDLSKYTHLKILYLDDNMIMNVEDDAFKDKTSLEILAMSCNSFVKIPPIILHLPSLTKLYFSHNQNTNIVQDIENLKPVTSPLKYLELAFDNLTELPDLGILPTLTYFNITGNPHIKMNASSFAGICNLKLFYNNNTTPYFNDPCECWSLQKWLERRDVEFNSFNCLGTIDTCDTTVSSTDMEIFQECKRRYHEIVMKDRIYKIVIPICVGLGILLIIIIAVGYGCMKRRKSKTKPLESKVTEEEKIFFN